MAKDEPAGENPPSKRLRQFRKLFNDYTNKDARKSGGRRSSASPVDSLPVSTPTRRSLNRTPRSRKKEGAVRSRGAEPREPSPATPEKKKESDDEGAKPVAEAKELAKADDEEFENAADNLAKCKIKQRELQWKGGATDDDKNKKKSEVTEADKNVYKSMDKDDVGDIAIRKKKSRATPTKNKEKDSRRKKTAGSIGHSPVFNPSAEVLDDLPTPEKLDRGVRCRAKRTGDPNRRSPSAEVTEVTTDLQEID
ncbi:hypothetical protein PENTCL1PPCAC_10383, partial [Pristionchus entomophagus]